MSSNTPLIIGLTGGIGSGKSTAADIFAGLGAKVVDADAISRQLTAPGGQALTEIRSHFGDQAIDQAGGLNRPWMRQKVFDQAQARQQLEAIIHPWIEKTIHAQVQQARSKQYKLLVLDIPLLVESLPRWQPMIDQLVVVDCPPETQIERVMARSQLPREQIQAIMAAQASREQRLAVADHVLDNGPETSLQQLQAQIANWLKHIGH